MLKDKAATLYGIATLAIAYSTCVKALRDFTALLLDSALTLGSLDSAGFGRRGKNS
jgi:hypothetical protein